MLEIVFVKFELILSASYFYFFTHKEDVLCREMHIHIVLFLFALENFPFRRKHSVWLWFWQKRPQTKNKTYKNTIFSFAEPDSQTDPCIIGAINYGLVRDCFYNPARWTRSARVSWQIFYDRSPLIKTSINMWNPFSAGFHLWNVFLLTDSHRRRRREFWLHCWSLNHWLMHQLVLTAGRSPATNATFGNAFGNTAAVWLVQRFADHWGTTQAITGTDVWEDSDAHQTRCREIGNKNEFLIVCLWVV